MNGFQRDYSVVRAGETNAWPRECECACVKNKLWFMHVAVASVARLGQISHQARCSQGCQIGREIWPNLETLAVGSEGQEEVEGAE